MRCICVTHHLNFLSIRSFLFVSFFGRKISHFGGFTTMDCFLDLECNLSVVSHTFKYSSWPLRAWSFWFRWFGKVWFSGNSLCLCLTSVLSCSQDCVDCAPLAFHLLSLIIRSDHPNLQFADTLAPMLTTSLQFIWTHPLGRLKLPIPLLLCIFAADFCSRRHGRSRLRWFSDRSFTQTGDFTGFCYLQHIKYMGSVVLWCKSQFFA